MEERVEELIHWISGRGGEGDDAKGEKKDKVVNPL